jgi:hypothetical protein
MRAHEARYAPSAQNIMDISTYPQPDAHNASSPSTCSGTSACHLLGEERQQPGHLSVHVPLACVPKQLTVFTPLLTEKV